MPSILDRMFRLRKKSKIKLRTPCKATTHGKLPRKKEDRGRGRLGNLGIFISLHYHRKMWPLLKHSGICFIFLNSFSFFQNVELFYIAKSFFINFLDFVSTLLLTVSSCSRMVSEVSSTSRSPLFPPTPLVFFTALLPACLVGDSGGGDFGWTGSGGVGLTDFFLTLLTRWSRRPVRVAVVSGLPGSTPSLSSCTVDMGRPLLFRDGVRSSVGSVSTLLLLLAARDLRLVWTTRLESRLRIDRGAAAGASFVDPRGTVSLDRGGCGQRSVSLPPRLLRTMDNWLPHASYSLEPRFLLRPAKRRG